MINCTTNDPSAFTRLYFRSLYDYKFQPFENDDHILRKGDVFTIINFGTTTAGSYQCRSTNYRNQTITWRDPSKEVTPVDEHKPEAKISTKNVTLDVGDKFNLNCTSGNENKVNLFKVNKTSGIKYPISKSRLIIKKETDSTTITLLIINAQIVDRGYYECEATYEDKTDAKRAYIEVLGKLCKLVSAVFQHLNNEKGIICKSDTHIRMWNVSEIMTTCKRWSFMN